MSDTVPTTIIVSSLGSDGLVFLTLPDSTPDAGALHVNGGAHAEPGSIGLAVEFRTLAADMPVVAPPAPPPDPAPSVSGSVAFMPDRLPDVIAGALQHIP